MALIKCSECGHEVSDKASTCPNCGCPIEKGFVCDECGAELSPIDKVCPNCGNPISEKIDEKSAKAFPKTALVFLILVVLGGVGYGVSHFLKQSLHTPSVEMASVDSVSEERKLTAEDLEEKRKIEDARQAYLEREKKKEQQEVSWIYGTWTYTAYGSTAKFIISRDNITIYSDGSIEYNGTYEIRGNELHYNTHNGMSDYIIIDNNSQRLKADETSYLSKVSSSVGNVPSGSSNRSSNDYSQYSTNEGRQAYLEVLQLQKEVRALIDRSAPYRSIMQREVYGSYNYQTARMQNMDILNAAIQRQEKALRIARNKLHDESLIRELSGQLETLNKAKYSD